MQNTITVISKLYDGSPKEAENEFFKYHFISRNDGLLLYKKTNEYIHCRDLLDNPELLEKARSFHDEINLLIKNAEESYKKNKDEKALAEARESDKKYQLTIDEYKDKARIWDVVMNEGEDGYNPYLDS